MDRLGIPPEDNNKSLKIHWEENKEEKNSHLLGIS